MSSTSSLSADPLMTPVDLIRDFSVEMTAKDTDSLIAAAPMLPQGTRISITYLPSEEHVARTSAAKLVRDLGFVPVPHISARRLESEAELDRYLADLASAAGLDRCLVVAGDCEPAGPFADALDVIRTGRVAAYGVKRVGISGYPEGHPGIPSELLWRAMRDKHELLISLGQEPIITTQFGFDAQAMLTWVSQVRDRGISSTIRLGVPGPASIKSLLRFAARCGVGASTKVLRKYGISITQLLTVAGPDRLLAELSERFDARQHGKVRIHFYPFGGLFRTMQWVRDFSPAG